MVLNLLISSSVVSFVAPAFLMESVSNMCRCPTPTHVMTFN